MSETAAVGGKAPSMGKFERFLTLWVALCIIVGIGLGQAVPGVFHAPGAATVALSQPVLRLPRARQTFKLGVLRRRQYNKCRFKDAHASMNHDSVINDSGY